MKVGFIGLGTMGAGMAANLHTYLKKSNHGLIVHDVNRKAGESFLANGATWADSPRQVAEQCDVIFASLPGPPEVEARHGASLICGRAAAGHSRNLRRSTVDTGLEKRPRACWATGPQ